MKKKDYKDKLIYIRADCGMSMSEPSKIEFEFDTIPDIKEFKLNCMRLASALGYTPNVIKKVFGEEFDEKLKNKVPASIIFKKEDSHKRF